MSGATTNGDPPKNPRRLLLTPYGNPPRCYITRRLSIPNSADWIALVNGALSTLISEEYWEEREGGQTVEETTREFMGLWLDYIGALDMIGAVIPMITDVLPTWMLWADGSTYLRADYPTLYGSLPTAFIIDADHFFVPDLRGRVVVGSGAGDGLTERTLGETGGEETHQLTTGEMPTHQHTIHGYGLTSRVGALDTYDFMVRDIVNSFLNTDDAGGDEAHNNMQPYFALRFAIVAKSRDAC